MVDFPAEEIGRWIYKEYKHLNPDIVIPIGHRIFNLLFLLREESKEWEEIYQKVVDINAIHYMDCNNKCIMLIDEETEYGRKFFCDAFSHFNGMSLRSVNCYTIFLRDDVKPQNRRETNIREWIKIYPEMREIANSLRTIKPFKAYDNSEDFHSAMFNFREFIKSNLKKPYNMDATLFCLSLDKSFNEFDDELSNYGPLFWYDEDTLVLVPNFFDVKRYSNLEGAQIIDGTLPKLRIFKSNRSWIVSPMAYFSIKFASEDVVFDTEAIFNNYPMLYHIFKAWQEHSTLTNKSYITRLYDLLVLWIDIELFRNFVWVLKKRDIDFKFEIEEYCLTTHYGKELGNKLLKIIEEELDISIQPTLDLYSKVEYDINPYNINTNTATLLSIKAACLKQYEDAPPFERRGLTFSGIQEELNLDSFSTSICIDLICDNAVLKPFDRIKEGLQVARFYNTDIEHFIDIFKILMWRASSKGIKIGRTNLGKFTTFIDYFAININNKYKYPIKIIDAPQGKGVRVIDGEKDIDKYLEDLLTTFPMYKDIFYFKDRQYKIYNGISRKVEHLDIVPSEMSLVSYIDLILDMYKKLEKYLDEHPEIVDSKGYRRSIYDVFPGFIELFGKGYPEGGLEIVGVLTKRALYFYEVYLTGGTLKKGKDPKKEADFLLFDVIPHKIKMYDEFSEIYLECYKDLSDPHDPTKRDVWKGMCVYPSSSLILEFCNKIILYIQEKIKSVLATENESLQMQKLKNLEKEVTKFLDLMINCSIGEPSKVQYLPKGFSDKRYIASIDLENSTGIGSILKDTRWEPINSYFINIMHRWVEVFDGKVINFPEGDGIIIAFQDFPSARSFTAGCCTQLTEISESINQCKTFEDYTTGCYGKITHSFLKVDENRNCTGEELRIMFKSEYLPKKEGKIVIDAKAIGECIGIPGAEFVEGERSHCTIDPKEEFKKTILSQFE